MIYDCFTFFNELDLLELRIQILNDVVDKFVLVEATKTFSNIEKELYYQNNKERFKKYSDKIIHVVVDQFPEYTDAWAFEKHQRNCIMSGLKNCESNDIIIISDTDEIPNPEKIKKYAQTPGIKTFKQRMFYYYLNNIDLHQPFWVNTPSKMLKFNELNTLDNSPQKVRFQSGKIINRGGWHFSYLGGAEKISAKIKSFAHQEYNQTEFNDVATIQARVEQGKDIFLRSSRKRYASIKIDKSFPKFLQEHQAFFNNYIKSENITNLDKTILLINKILQNIKIYLKNTINKYYSRNKHHHYE